MADDNGTYIYVVSALSDASQVHGNLTSLVSESEPATTAINDEIYLSNERVAEGMFLMMMALAGISLNLMVFCSVFLCQHLRHYINGFIVHGCILDAFKSALCIPYSLAVLQLVNPDHCQALGLAYVVSLTVSMFNLLAMVMAEAYVFHEHNISDTEGDNKGAAMCIAFGVTTIYIGSIILHLGPTLIGGEFKFNRDVGNCMFAYGEKQNYIVQVIWVIIVSITLMFIFRYIYKFYRQLKANQRFRITNLARNAAAYTKGQNPTDDIYDLVHQLKRRVRVLLCMATVYCICWYPLFFLTLIDVKYRQPGYLYRVLTVIAWSHSTIMPLVLLVVDHNFGIVHQIRRVVQTHRGRYKPHSPSTQPLTRDDSNIHGSLYNHTMHSDGRATKYMDSPAANHRVVYEAVRCEETGYTRSPPMSPARQTTSSSKLSDYDGLSLEESPL